MNYDFDLLLTEEARRQMEERMILDTDLYAVIDAFRKTDAGVVDSATGLTTSCVRLGNVTFWACFRELDESRYEVVSCYSHRMTIETR